VAAPAAVYGSPGELDGTIEGQHYWIAPVDAGLASDVIGYVLDP
jgi:hypothetical protein